MYKFLFLFILNLFVFNIVEAQDISEPIIEGELVSCSQYFNGVTAQIFTDSEQYENGDPIILKGVIVNENSFPLVNVDVRVRFVNDKNGQEIIYDEFMVLEDVNINSNSSVDINYTYLLPLNIKTDEYSIFLDVIESDTFKIFKNNNMSSRAEAVFYVEGNNDSVFLSDFEKDNNVVSFNINNETTQSKEIKITYDLYPYHSISDELKINTFSEVKNVSSGEILSLNYLFPQVSESMVNLVVTAEVNTLNKDSSVYREKSIFRMTSEIENKVGVVPEFLGINSYPLEKGNEYTLLTCFRDISHLDQDPYTIETILYDESNREIGKAKYQGGNIEGYSGLINTFTTKKDLYNLKIVSNIYDSNQTKISSIEKVYGCSDEECSKENNSFVSIMNIVLGLGIILILLFILKLKNKKIYEI